MKLSSLLEALEDIAPTRYAEEWDNVGLLAGDPAQEVSRVLLTIDCTAAVLEEAARHGCELVVAYHPPLFKAVRRVVAGDTVYEAVRRGIALFSPHTALDVAEGGTNDLLADALGLTERAPLKLHATRDAQYKLVYFVPEAAREQVSTALFAAGAGKIGDYSSCSFRSPGTGTFFGEAGTQPAVGKSGKLEEVSEIRVETVVPVKKVEAVLRALRDTHPYEEPAFDLVRLAAPPEGIGIGRIGSLTPTPVSELLAKLKQALEVPQLLVAAASDKPVSRVAVCAGAGGELLGEAIRQRAQLFVTGELRHHDALAATRAGVSVVCALHSNSERAVLRRVKARLDATTRGIRVLVSEVDRDPFVFA